MRRCTVKHPFGTIKARMGPTHVLTLRPRAMRNEIAPQVPARDIKRMLAPSGIPRLMRAIPG